MNDNNLLTGALIGVLIYYIVTHNKQRMEHHKRKMMMQGYGDNQQFDFPYQMEDMGADQEDDMQIGRKNRKHRGKKRGMRRDDSSVYDEQTAQQDEQSYQEDNAVVYQNDYGVQEEYYPTYDDNSPHEEAFFPNFFENSYGEVIYEEPQNYYIEPQYVGSNVQPVYVEPQYEYEYSQPNEQQPEVIEAVFVGQPQVSTDVIATTVVPKGLYTEDKYDALKQYNGQEVYAVDSNNRTLRGVLNTDTMTIPNQNPNAPVQALDVRQAKTIRLVVGNKMILEPPVKRIKKLAIPEEGMLTSAPIGKGLSLNKNTELVAPKPSVESTLIVPQTSVASVPVPTTAPMPERLITAKLPSKMTLPKGVRGGSMDLTQLI
jgi:hypothetical protein